MTTVNLIDLNKAEPDCLLHDVTMSDAAAEVASGDVRRIDAIDGQFGIAAQDGSNIRMARTLGVIRRYFILKTGDTYTVLFSDRISKILTWCRIHGFLPYFDPYYTRMVPAHHLVTLDFSGLEPRAETIRFFQPDLRPHSPRLEQVAESYVSALEQEIKKSLKHVPLQDTLGILCSGGIDSSSVAGLVWKHFPDSGRSRDRIKVFTLSIGDGGSDLSQAETAASALGFRAAWQPVVCRPEEIDISKTIHMLEDYHPLDVQDAAVARVLLSAIRRQVPDVRVVADGDGNDENLKSYPLADSPVTLDEVFDQPLLYQEGWPPGHPRYNATFSNGLSRSYSRTFLTGKALGFRALSPFCSRSVIREAVRVPFRELARGQEQELYQLKGRIMAAGLKSVAGLDLPVFPKTRFQQGCMSAPQFAASLASAQDKAYCKQMFALLHRW